MDSIGGDSNNDNTSGDNNNSKEKTKPKDNPADTKKGEDEKKDDGVRPTDWKDTNSWVAFLKLLFHFFIITLLVGLFGSSFIYLTTRGSDLDTILPTDDQFYSAKSYQVQKKGPSNVIECSETSTGMFSAFEDNFPYNLIKIKGSPTKEQLKTLTMVERMTTWFAKCVAGCFKSNRALLKGWLDNFGPEGPLGNHVFQIYIAAPFTILISFIALATGFWSAFGAGVSADMKVTVWGGFLLYSWGLFGGLAGVIFLRMIGTICFYPMSQNWKEVANIMACNVKPLVVLFGFFVCGAAYDTLEPTMAGIMGIVYLCLVAWTVWKYFSSQLF